MAHGTASAPLAIPDLEAGTSVFTSPSPAAGDARSVGSKSLPGWVLALVACVAVAACMLCLFLAAVSVPDLTTVEHHGKLGAFKVFLPLGTLPLDHGEGALARAGPSFLEFGSRPVQSWGTVTADAVQEDVIKGGHAASAASGPRIRVPTVLDAHARVLHAAARAAPWLAFTATSTASRLRSCVVWLRTLEALSWSSWWPIPVAVLMLLLLASCSGIVGQACTRTSPSSASKSVSAAEPTSCEPLSEDDMDLLEAFDDLDRGRQGFVHCGAIRTLLGNPATESDVIRAVAASTPCFGVLFYADFVRLAQRPGPLAALLTDRKARRRRLLSAQNASSPGSPKRATNYYTRRAKA